MTVNDQAVPITPPRLKQAVADLRRLILMHFPGAEIEVGPGGDDPTGTYLVVTVDLDDPDEVMDLVIDRVVEYQVEHNLPIHVVPIRTSERVAQMQRQPQRRQYLAAQTHLI